MDKKTVVINAIKEHLSEVSDKSFINTDVVRAKAGYKKHGHGNEHEEFINILDELIDSGYLSERDPERYTLNITNEGKSLFL